MFFQTITPDLMDRQSSQSEDGCINRHDIDLKSFLFYFSVFPSVRLSLHGLNDTNISGVE